MYTLPQLHKHFFKLDRNFVFAANAHVYPFGNSGVPQDEAIKGAQFVKHLLNTQEKQLLI